MKFILILFLLGGIVYFVMRKMSALFNKSASASVPAVLQQAKAGINISITDGGPDGMPVITIRSDGATLNIQSVKQEARKYIISAEKQADNVAVVLIDKKT
ncbi:MAG: hypothetical protein C0402_03755 [Thermodesulfovibrio sp.]|nr:hypothetical protein [Thermodesulfovibrio sp.]